MSALKNYFKLTATYQIFKLFSKLAEDFFETLGVMAKHFIKAVFFAIKLDFSRKDLINQCSRFAVDSLPITLSIVGMTAIIISMQTSGEMVKQGAGSYVGMLTALVMVRELSAIMSGFAIISMIGSSFASELATMRVTEQIDAIKVLKVSPIKYLFTPKIIAGFVMMPIVVIFASFIGIICSGITAKVVADISWLNFISSVWHGLVLKDINICMLKSAVFGATISLISCSCGYKASGGAKGVGLATTKAVVWAFIAIVILDYVFALVFYF